MNTTKYTLSFSTPDVVADVASVEVAEGYTYKLEPAGNYNDYTFAGWTDAALGSVTTTAPTLYKAGEKYTMGGADKTLYAVYSYTGENSGSGNFEKVTENLSDWSGEYLIVYENGNNSLAFNGELEKLDQANKAVTVTITDDDVIVGTDALAKVTFTITQGTTNYTIQSASGIYIGRTANSNGIDESATEEYYAIYGA